MNNYHIIVGLVDNEHNEEDEARVLTEVLVHFDILIGRPAVVAPLSSIFNGTISARECVLPCQQATSNASNNENQGQSLLNARV